MKPLIVLGIILMFISTGCNKKDVDTPLSQLHVQVQALSTCSKVVNLKDRLYVKQDAVIELSYTWKTEPNFTPFPKNYIVWAHFESENGDVIWIEDHMPSPPTTQWKPGQSYEYKDIIQIPKHVADPRINLYVGLYDRSDLATRIYLPDEKNKPVRKVKVARFYVQPEDRELFKEGWSAVEFGKDSVTQWRWIVKKGVYSFRNPGIFSFLYIKGATLLKCFPEKPTVTVAVNGRELDRFLLAEDSFTKVYPLPLDLLGDSDWCDISVATDKIFTPKTCGQPDDPRELGIMINDIIINDVHYREGWHDPELSKTGFWRWSTKRGVVEFGNPHTDVIIAIDGEINADLLKAMPTIQIVLNGEQIASYTLDSERIDKVLQVPIAKLGNQSMVSLELITDRTVIPAQSIPGSTDQRELGLRVKAIRILPQAKGSITQ